MNIPELATVTIVAILAVISPGPDFILVTRNTLLYSKKAGLATALGIATGNLWWIGASLLGISYAISKAVILFNIMKWLGAAYLIYIGIKALCAKKSQDGATTNTEDSEKKITNLAAFQMGVITNILNPKCALFFVSFFSVIISPTTSTLMKSIYGLEVMLIAAVWFSLLATVLSISKVKATFNHIQLWVERVTGAILIALGLKLALSNSR